METEHIYYFYISVGQDNTAILKLEKGLDFETRDSYSLKVKAFNSIAPTNKVQTAKEFTVNIQVEDENEPPLWQNKDVEFAEGQEQG